METIEIENFQLSISFSQYWISYEKNGDRITYPVIISPYNLVKLFEIEGLDLTKETDSALEDDGINFNKSTLIRYKATFGGDLRGEVDNDLTAQPCWAKLN